MSKRAAWRLETLGFEQVHHYTPGKEDWMAAGLPIEGSKASIPRVGGVARRDVPTCRLDEVDPIPGGFWVEDELATMPHARSARDLLTRQIRPGLPTLGSRRARRQACSRADGLTRELVR